MMELVRKSKKSRNCIPSSRTFSQTPKPRAEAEPASRETAAGQLLARPLALLFVSYDEALLAMTLRAFRIFSFSFLLSGFGIFGSAFFTALNDGAVSALLSFLRTMVFQCSMVLLLPLVWELDGVWVSVVAAEALAVLVTALFLVGKQKKYHY